MNQFDAVDGAILEQREREFNLVDGPRVGDFLRTPEGLLRFTHDWGDTIQTTVGPRHPCRGDASFFLSNDGHVSFSGSLDPGIDKSQLKDTGEIEEGYFWFFHHNEYRAHNGVTFKIRCRVFEAVQS